MQLFIDLDLREAINSPGDRSLISTIQASSQDTLEMDVYFVRAGNVINPGAGVALKFGLFKQAATTALALQTAFTQKTDSATGNVFWQGLVDFNTAEMQTALGTSSAMVCNAQLRYQLSDGEIIHSIYLPFSIFPALLQETGTPPPAPADTYPDVTQLVLVSQKGAPGGVAELDGGGLMNPAEIPIDGQTIVLSTGKLSVPIDGLSLTLQAGKLAVSIDGQSIVLNNGVLESGLVLTTFKTNWQTPGANADIAVEVNDSTKLKTGQAILVPIAGFYTVKTITDVNNVTLTNDGDPFNVGSGVTVLAGAVILPAQLAAGGGGSISLAIGTVTTLTPGSSATAGITGTSPSFTLNLGIPAGVPGGTPTLAIGSVSTLPAGSAATAGIIGTAPNFTLNLGIPAGAPGGGGSGGGGGLSSISDVDTTSGDLNLVYDGGTGKLKGLRFDPLFGATDAGQYLNIPFPAYPRVQAAFTMPAIGANSGSVNIQNQGGLFLQPGMWVYISGAGLLSVVSTATSGGQDSAVFQNIGSQQGFTNAIAGATIAAGAWLEIVQQAVTSLADAETTEGFSLIASSAGVLKRILIPSWLQPVDTGQEIKINAGAPAGAGDMTRAAYDILTATPNAVPSSVVDQARILVAPSAPSLRNYIDNPYFRVFQRGPFSTAVTAAGFQLDRWQYTSSGAGVMSLATVQYNGGLASTFPWSVNSVKLTVTTASTPGASDSYVFQHALEAIDANDLSGNATPTVYGSAYLRFFVKATITGTLGLSLYNTNQALRLAHDFVIAAANTWYEVDVSIPAFNIGNPQPGASGLVLRLVLGAGSNNRLGTTVDSWGGGASQYVCTTNSTDWIATANASIEFMAFSLNAGRQPIIRQPRFDDDLRRCQRFFCKSYDLATVPGTASVTNGQVGFVNAGAATNTAQGYCPFPVRMTKVPTAANVTIYDPTSGAAGAARNAGNATQATGVTAAGIGEAGFGGISSSGANIQASSGVNFHYTASAEI